METATLFELNKTDIVVPVEDYYYDLHSTSITPFLRYNPTDRACLVESHTFRQQVRCYAVNTLVDKYTGEVDTDYFYYVLDPTLESILYAEIEKVSEPLKKEVKEQNLRADKAESELKRLTKVLNIGFIVMGVVNIVLWLL